MTKMLTCISPIDGSVFAERPCLDRGAVFGLAGKLRKAQTAWAARPIEERIALVQA